MFSISSSSASSSLQPLTFLSFFYFAALLAACSPLCSTKTHFYVLNSIPRMRKNLEKCIEFRFFFLTSIERGFHRNQKRFNFHVFFFLLLLVFLEFNSESAAKSYKWIQFRAIFLIFCFPIIKTFFLLMLSACMSSHERDSISN